MARSDQGLLALLAGAAGPSRTWTAKEAVRWLLQFAETDLDGLPPDALADLSEEAMRFTEQPDRITPDGLKVWQEEAKSGLAAYFEPRGGAGGWRYDIQLRGRVYKWGAREQLVLSEIPGGTNREVFAWFAIVAILAVGSDLKRCANVDCGQPFVADGRQAYCSRVCSDRVRVGKFRKALAADPTRKEKALARRRRAYRQKQRAKLGANVKVGKRG